jgi:hypothetical protein
VSSIFDFSKIISFCFSVTEGSTVSLRGNRDTSGTGDGRVKGEFRALRWGDIVIFAGEAVRFGERGRGIDLVVVKFEGDCSVEVSPFLNVIVVIGVNGGGDWGEEGVVDGAASDELIGEIELDVCIASVSIKFSVTESSETRDADWAEVR